MTVEQIPKKNASEYEGAKKTTCKEASRLLKEGSAIKAWFRPGGVISPTDPDNDPAFVWTRE